MKRIHRLPEALANQIAAGEVVERPASAVKELVENAIDAGARRIEIRLEDGGRRRVEVVDDGSGMSREDALLALERHTTSKLETAEQLFDIQTFGFRGEAIPSIASVSRFTLTTRQADDVAATRISIEGGKILSVEDAGAPVGTRVEVADLFYNVPARLKFLKTRATELGHVVDWVTRLALAHPSIGFLIEEDGRVHLKADPTTDRKERIAALLGRDLYGALYPIAEERDDLRISGFAAGPQRANSTAREIFTYVNGRFIRDRGLLHAIARAYEGVLPIGRSPACVLFLEIAPGRVDVNVHPQKLEVRFSDTRPVYDIVVRSIGNVLAGSPWLTRPQSPARTYALRPVEALPAEAPASQPPAAAPPLAPVQQRIAEAMNRFAQSHVPEPPPLRARDVLLPSPPARVEPPPVPVPTEQPPVPAPAGQALSFGSLRYLGQIHRTYLVCESPDGLLLLDQHAAHERVLYERYRLARAGCETKGQPFLVPVTLELSPSDARAVEAALEDLGDLGFELEPFGGATFSLKAAPPELEGSDLPTIIRELAQEVRTLDRGTLAETLEEQLLARMACHSAVRAGHALGPEEVTALLQSLDGTPFHAQCPHGRPVVVRFDAEALREMFGRTYEGTPRAAGRERIAR
jgi:DNA mismatch repair protein MutL